MSIILCTDEDVFPDDPPCPYCGDWCDDECEIDSEAEEIYDYNSYDTWKQECGIEGCCTYDPNAPDTPTSDSKGGKLSIHDIDNANHQTLLVLDHKNANGAFESRASRVEQSVNGYNIKVDTVHVNEEDGENVSAKDVREAAKDAGYNGVLTYRSV